MIYSSPNVSIKCPLIVFQSEETWKWLQVPGPKSSRATMGRRTTMEETWCWGVPRSPWRPWWPIRRLSDGRSPSSSRRTGERGLLVNGRESTGRGRVTWCLARLLRERGLTSHPGDTMKSRTVSDSQFVRFNGWDVLQKTHKQLAIFSIW